jgi:uncharacterized protein
MRAAERLRALWLRWEGVALALALALPLLVAMALGFVWLWERGWLLAYAAGCAGFVLAVRLARRQAGAPVAPTAPPLAPDADWSADERAAYGRAQARSREALAAPVPWEALPARALAVVEGVAGDLSGGRRGVLDFTAPEALLLVERLAGRTRRVLLRQVPFADRLSIQALWWVWRQRDAARSVAVGGWTVWRGVRLVLNPASALLREVEGRLAGALQDRLGAAVTRDLQLRLMDEAAAAAIDLYSGRLRFTEAELAAARLPDEVRDAAAAGRPEPVLRVMLVGQLGTGKSSLFNALAGEDLAETDAAPTTDRAQAVETVLAGQAVRLVDTPGLDGGARRRDAVAAEAAEADLILWVLRADRPDRAPDLAARAALALKLGEGRRAPPVVSVVAAADLVLPGWPWPEHRLPPEARDRLAAALAALAEDWPGAAVPVSLRPAPWNLDALEAAVAAALPEARQTARQRRRLAAARPGTGAVLAQAGRGIGAVAGSVAEAIAARLRR